MMIVRSIVHLDADAFFASVEQAADPRLRGRPIAVGGEKRGIIASASYEARKFGVYTPMPTVKARRLCPKLILLPGDFEKYELFSRLMFSYAYDFTPDVEVGSIDEGYFDLTGTRKPAVGIAATIRQAIRQGLKLSVSEGVASNKLVSQIASKLKKPSAFEFVPYGQEAEFISPLANKWLPGIGPKTATQLNSAGLAFIGQIAQTPAELLGLLVGSMAPQLRSFARGLDERPVVPVHAPAKSYGEQETFAVDTTDEEFLEATLRRMADKLMAKVRQDGKCIRTVTVKVRYNDMDEQQAAESLAEPTDLETDIYNQTSVLLRKAWQRRVSLRLVSLRLSNVYEGRLYSGLALHVSARQHAAEERLAGIVDDLRQKYGRSVLLRGHDFVLRTKTRLTADHADGADKFRARVAPLNGVGTGRPRPQFMGKGNVPYNHAVVQRQRLGNSIALRAPDAKTRYAVSATPGVELRFRMQTSSPRLITPPASSSLRSAGFIPLNIHSYYSFLDSTLSIRAIIELAKRHDLPAIALTDKNNLHGAVEFALAAAEAGIKPIIGAELDCQGRRVCLYAENEKGYHSLCKILSQRPPGGNPTSEIRNPKEGRNPKSELELPGKDTLDFGFFSTEGLLAVSADPALARFFPGRFYFEIDGVEAFEKRPAGLPCAASLPIHYELPNDRWKYDIVQSIRTLTLLRQAHPQKRLDGEYHFRPGKEMRQIFGAHPELLAHSREIADRCSFTLSPGKPQFPSYRPPDGSTPAAFLYRLVMEGLHRRYPKDHARLKPQLEEELAIIMDVGYEEYFLVMWDILQECRRRGIEWITRGSAADSLACYCLEISGVCPIRFDLYFRRFLNKDRMALNKLPDIDVDFAHDRKDDVIDLIFEKYGPECVAVVGGFSTFQARSAFAEVAKVLGVSDFQVRRLTERFPHFAHSGELAEAIAGTQECRDLPLNEEPYAAALKMGQFLDGFPRYPKMHPCGLVLSRQPMHEITPCFISAKGYPATHFDMDSVEAVGLVKMDILAQGGLAVMRDVKGMWNADCGLRNENSAIDLEALEPWEGPEVWDLIASGNARAVHHIESPAMISLCKMCNVRDIDTLIAIVSVIRPGAANESKKMEFARRYQGLSPVRYPHASLERCLRSTYGLVVYEEHILQICESFAGLPPGRADVLRRALAKEHKEIVAQVQIEFAECARKRGRTEAEITEVWNLVSGFRGYAFCKAHSTAYGVEAYQSAWLKRNYPAEFMAAVLTNGKGFYSPLVYVLECHRLGIPFLPPFVNEPGPPFTVTVAERPPRSEIRNPKPEIRNSKSEIRGLIAKLASLELGETCSPSPLPSPQGEGTAKTGRCHASGPVFADRLTTIPPLPLGEGRDEGNFEQSHRSDRADLQLVPEIRNKSEIRNPQSAIRNHSIRVPVLNVKGLTVRTKETILRERERGEFSSLADFFLRVQPLPEEIDALIRVGAFDEFGQNRTAQYWQFKSLDRTTVGSRRSERCAEQLWLLPPGNIESLSSVPLVEPGRLERLRAEEELLGYAVSGHPLELFPDIAWETYCPINRLAEHIGEQIVTCGLVIEQRLFHQVTGEPMKFLTIADWTGIIETELFARTYQSYGLNTVRYRVLEITAIVEPFENGRGHTLRVLRAGKPREKA